MSASRHRMDGLWGRQIRAQEASVKAARARFQYKSHGSWGNWVRIKQRCGQREGDAICFIGEAYDYIVVLWDDAATPEMLHSSELLHYGYWHKRKDWYPFNTK